MKQKNNGGRPKSFKKEYARQAEILKRNGMNDKQVADFFGICEATLNNWKHEYSLFLEHYKKGLKYAQVDVIKGKLYQRAHGMTVTESSVEDDGKGTIKKKVTKKELPPDTGAIMCLLHNYAPDEFKPRKPVADGNESGTGDDALKDLLDKLPT